jgi:hypothetical protein
MRFDDFWADSGPAGFRSADRESDNRAQGHRGVVEKSSNSMSDITETGLNRGHCRIGRQDGSNPMISRMT